MLPCVYGIHFFNTRSFKKYQNNSRRLTKLNNIGSTLYESMFI